MDEKTRELMEAGSDCLEAAVKLLDALRKIALADVTSPEAKRLQAIAKDAIESANDIVTLGERLLIAENE
jgi:methionine aminopeptidase